MEALGAPGKHLLCPMEPTGPAVQAQRVPHQQGQQLDSGEPRPPALVPHILQTASSEPGCTMPTPTRNTSSGRRRCWSGARTQATAHGSFPALHTLAVRPWASHLTPLCLRAALLVAAAFQWGLDRAQAGAGHVGTPPGQSASSTTPSFQMRCLSNRHFSGPCSRG